MSLISSKYTMIETKYTIIFENITKLNRNSHAIDVIQRDEDATDYIKIGAIKAVRLG